MKNPLAPAGGRRGPIPVSAWLFAAFVIVVFSLSVNRWAKAYEGTRHEIQAVFDATGLASFSFVSNGNASRAVLTFPVYYKDAVCDWDIRIDALGEKGPEALGTEVWVQSIMADGNPLDWSKVHAEGWTSRDSVHGANGKALACFDEDKQHTLTTHARANTLTITYSRHQWTGRMRLTVNGESRVIDTWSESFIPEKTTFYAPPTEADHVENQTASIYITPLNIGGDTQLRLPSGTVTVKCVTYDGRRLPIAPDGTLELPSRFSSVWLPALSIGAAATLALSLVAALLWIPARKHPLWFFFALATLVRLWLAGGEEIRANLYDSDGYMISSLHHFWELSFTPHAYDRQPGYPLFISAARIFGIPLRIWVELAWCASCLTVATALPRLRLPQWSAGLAYTLMVFNPITYAAFSFGYQDIAYAPFLLFFLGALLHLLPQGRRERILASLGAGLAGALVWNTRPEHILLMGMLATFAIVFAFAEWMENRNAIKSAIRTTAYIVPIVAGIASVTLVFSAYGRTTRLGAFATCNFQLKGFTSLYNELLAIKPAKAEPYHPVPTDVRETAYRFSPSFATLRGPLEGPALELYAPMARAGDGIENDYGTYFFWALRIAPWYDKQWPTADALDRFYSQCASELREAREKGSYPSRRVWANFVEPDASTWLPYLDDGMATYAGMLTRTDVELLPPEDANVRSDVFDEAALRRSHLVKANEAIWTTDPDPERRNVKGALAALSAWSTRLAAILMLPALALLLWRLIRRKDTTAILASAAAVLLLEAFFSRFMLFSLMHAVAYRAEPRYILPVAAIPALLLSIFLVVGWEELTRILKSRKDTTNARKQSR
jgi:hypothetical protein